MNINKKCGFSCSILLVALIFLISGVIFLNVNEIQPDPYMDEIFHIPQAQKYCDGNFTEWDPMITTLPGLYIASVVILKPLQLLSWTNDTFCSTIWLRGINMVFAVGNFALLYHIGKITYDDKRYDVLLHYMMGAALFLFPLLYFFTFLYYTDAGATFFVLLMYHLHQRKHHFLAATAGLVAVLFRQTNVVWVIFMAGLSFNKIVQNFVDTRVEDQFKNVILLLKTVLKRFQICWKHDRKVLVHIAKDIAVEVFPYTLVVLGFCLFVIHNGSIVVGAKNDHQAGLHLPQVFYFAVFLNIFSFSHIISLSAVKRAWNVLLRHPFSFFLMLIFCSIVVGNFTIAHRYLLADNRHYTFYLWRRIFQRHYLIKFILIPGYIVSIWLALTALSKNLFWKVLYCVCVMANLIPATLIEFRYYVIPYLIYRLNLPQVTYLRLLAELFLYAVVNIFTVYAFLEMPFLWNNDAKLQRFMW